VTTVTIGGFGVGDTIDLASVASASGGSAILTSGNVLDVAEGGSTYLLRLDPSKNYTGTQFVLTSDGGGGTDVTINVVSVTSGQTLIVSSGHVKGGVLVLSSSPSCPAAPPWASPSTAAVPTTCPARRSAPRSMAGSRS
jgi:hypothetical protein